MKHEDFNPKVNEPIDLPERGSWPKSCHVFDETSVWAVKASLASGRPLLLRGEPGIGKSQLARAVAEVLEASFMPFVVQAGCESEDLLYKYDAVSRLAHAQIAGSYAETPEEVKEELAAKKFIQPSVLWWAYHYESAKKQFDESGVPGTRPPYDKPNKGAVVLIDEIDKADSSIPNSLLEAMANRGFRVEATGEDVSIKNENPPLIIITTNEERELPAAFVRRCLVVQMNFPGGDSAIKVLTDMAKVHFEEKDVDGELMTQVAELLLEDRAEAKKLHVTPPGFSEYLDTLRALKELHPGDKEKQEEALDKIASFAFDKHPKHS
ncbi:MAG: MoxR family ATPase [Verrucomicrobiota bacterium]